MLTNRQQGLDRVAVETEQRRLAEPRFGNGAGKRSEKTMGLARVAERVLEEAADCERLQVGGDDADCERERQPLVGRGTRFGNAPEVRIDACPGRQCERTLGFLGGLLATAITAINHLFEKKSRTLFLINAGYDVFGFCLMGVILALL